jgi:hypothetical protein
MVPVFHGLVPSVNTSVTLVSFVALIKGCRVPSGPFTSCSRGDGLVSISHVVVPKIELCQES